MQKRKKENVKNQIGINQTLTDKPPVGFINLQHARTAVAN